jgi:tRNA(Ile)-lysidine synthase
MVLLRNGLYHVSVHALAERLLVHLRRQELLQAGDRVGVAVSGGIDSIALLRLLLELRRELGIVVSVVHFNHKLRGAESDDDQEFVANLAGEFDLEFFVDSEDVGKRAAEEHVSIETAARELRYVFFRHLLGEEGTEEHIQLSEVHLKKIATGHTLDDQAETVLMRIIRGTGLRGVGAIYPRILVEDNEGEVSGEISRPLLGVRRHELEQYLKDIGQAWREDSTNADPSFARNRIRKLLVPVLEQEFNPAVAQNLAELAEIARGEEDYWENEISGWLGTTVQWSQPDWARIEERASSLVQISSVTLARGASPEHSDLRSKIDIAPWLVMNASVNRMWFLGEPLAVQRRLVKAIGENAAIPLEFKHVEEILRAAAAEGASGKEMSLPLGWKFVVEPDQLMFVTPDLRTSPAAHDYEYELTIPGRIQVYEAGASIEIRRVPDGMQAGYNPDHLLDAESLPGRLRVRNWRPGDRFWPAHTKSPKKIKELLQELRLDHVVRKAWPVIVGGDEIVWMRGFATPARLQAKPGRSAVVILDTPLSGTPAIEA